MMEAVFTPAWSIVQILHINPVCESGSDMSAKSILFINQHYYPEHVAAGQILTDLAEHLAAGGFEVTVLCGRGGYTGESITSPKEEKHNGVNIRRLRTTDLGRSSTLGRLTDYATFFVQALIYTLWHSKNDYVITLTTPPLINVLGAILQKVRNQKYGIWAMDLHPDAEVALGMIDSDSLVAQLLHRLNNIGYRNANFVIAIGDYMKQNIEKKGVSNSCLHVIPVWNKKEEVYPVPREENPLLKELGLGDRFVVMYSGNAGLFHRFDEVLELMRKLKGHSEIYFLFVGRGPKREQIVSYADRHNIKNFKYTDYFPRSKIKYSLSLADVHLLTLNREIAGIAVPSKLYGIMGVGRPVLMIGPRSSEPADTISDEQIGKVVEPKQKEEGVDMDAVHTLKNALMELHENGSSRKEFGKRGREAFLKRYEQEVACSAWADLLHQIS